MKHKHYNEIIAFAEGKTIQGAHKSTPHKWHTFTEGKCPSWFNDWVYRIKPEPEYVPFTFEDAEQLIGKAVRFKDGRKVRIIGGLNPVELNLCGGGVPVLYREMLEKYTFLDGTPCGKIKSDE